MQTATQPAAGQTEAEGADLGDAQEAEHADLVDHVVPGARHAHLLERLQQLLPHLYDAPRHALQLFLRSYIKHRLAQALALIR